MQKRVFYQAIATLVGTIIGAGVLGIPYVVAKAGFFTGLIDIILIGIALTVLNLYMGEVILRTRKKHQLVGYAGKYLGPWGKRIMFFSMFFGIYGALIAYIIGEGAALSAIFSGSPLMWSLIFFVFVSTIVFLGLKRIGQSELILTVCFLIIICLIMILSIPFIKLNNLAEFNALKLFLPYGVILFAFIGSAAIPEMGEQLSRNKKRLKKAIIIGSLIPLILYVVFALVVVGVTSKGTTEIATIGLGNTLGGYMVLFGNIFAVFIMATSFLALAFALEEVYDYDYGLNKILSWALACLIPLVIFLLGVKDFIRTIGIAGAVAGGINGVLIALMFHKAKKLGDRKPEFEIKSNSLISIVLTIIFIGGIVYSVLELLGIISF